MIMSSNNVPEIMFEAGEDLLNESKTQVLVFKGTTKTIDVSAPRALSSYCHEYCGMTGLSFSTLRFQNMGRDIRLDTMISDSVHATIHHKAEFTIEPPNNLKSSMKSMLMSGLYSDIDIKVDPTTTIKAHKCILYMRSKPMKDIIDKMMQETADGHIVQVIDLTEELKKLEGSKEAFSLMINFLYSGEIIFPKNPLDIINILKMAKQYQIEDLEELCEDEIIKKMEAHNILDILLVFEKEVKVSEDTSYRIKSYFLKNFEQISNHHPDIEEKLAESPGLIKKLFFHISGKKKLKRKVTFVDFDINVDSQHELLH